MENMKFRYFAYFAYKSKIYYIILLVWEFSVLVSPFTIKYLSNSYLRWYSENELFYIALISIFAPGLKNEDV